MALRVKGQEVVATFVSADGVEDSIADVKSLDIQFDRDILSEGYIGQTTEQKDDIFKGISGKIEFHVHNADFLDITNRINERSKRRAPGEIFQIAASISFPNGERRRIVIPNVFFGPIPLSTAGREDYVLVTYDFAADDARIIAA